MSIELYWDNDEQTVMLCVFEKDWSWDEMFTVLDTIKQVTDKRDDEIGAIIDVSHGFSVPGGSIFNPDTRDKASRLLKMSADGKGPIVIAGTNSFIRMISQGFNLLDKRALEDVYFTDTLEEARALLDLRLARGKGVSA